MAGARTSTRTEHRIDENGFDEAKVFTADGALLRHEVHLPRSTKAIAHFLDIAISFGIWHYSMWGVWALAFQVSLLNLASWSLESVLFVSAIQIAYWTWVVVYQPQYKFGAPDAFVRFALFNPILDRAFRYMNATAIREGPCPPAGKQFLFAYAPHGVLGMCRGGSGGSIFPALYPNQKDVKWASFGHAFFIPGFREFGLMFGCVDAAKEVLTKVARSSKKYSIKIVPGGIREMLFTDGEAPTTKLLLKDRYGFVKLAKEEGLDLIPVFCFGEKWATKTVALKPAWLARLLLKLYSDPKMKLSPVGFLGRGWTLLPFNKKPFGWVFGRPITTGGNKSVEELHAEFCYEIERIFEEYKARFGYGPEERLDIVSVKLAEEWGKGKMSNGNGMSNGNERNNGERAAERRRDSVEKALHEGSVEKAGTRNANA